MQNAKCGQNDHISPGRTSTLLAEQYRVSPKTIMRDVKLAEALTLIGEESPEAKRKILSGEVAINKSKLEALSAAGAQDIKDVAAEVEDGTYKRRAARAADNAEADSDAASILPEIRRLSAIIRDFASSFDSRLREMSAGGSAGLRAVLRSYIDRLEDLYNNIAD